MPDPAKAPVFVGVDGSPASELATAIAFDEASRRGVELIALHAWTDTEMSEYLPVVDWSGHENNQQRNPWLSVWRAGRNAIPM